MIISNSHSTRRSAAAATLLVIVCVALSSCATKERRPEPRTFDSPQAAAQTLIEIAKKGTVTDLAALFGADADALVQASDPVTARRNREVFSAAAAEDWHLEDEGANRKILVIGRERWPFPIPLVSDAGRWRFDTAAGREEILDRRIGRNELAVIQLCRTYVAAQRVYARHPHDGGPTGIYAKTFLSEPGRQNGLYWPASKGVPHSPLGDLVAHAADEGRPMNRPAVPPLAAFHGYHFKILTAQGASAPGGARDYIVDGAMTGGFALIAWPADYDVTGVMTFIVNQDGQVHQKDIGPDTSKIVREVRFYDPDATWQPVK